MPNFMLGDPAAIAFFKSVEAVHLFDKHRDEYPYLALDTRSSTEYEQLIDSLSSKLTQEANLYPSTETLTAMAFYFVSHVAFMQALTWSPPIDA